MPNNQPPRRNRIEPPLSPFSSPPPSPPPNNEPFRQKRKRPPSPREYRKRRRRDHDMWSIMEVPSSIDSIRDLLAFAYTYHGPNVNVEKLKGITEPLVELDRMVGLKTTKRTILDMNMHFVQGRHKKNEDYLHMVVCGPPGCGKTSFCRILGKILAGLKILPKDTFTIVKRTDFIAKYVGHTAHQTEELLNKCKGGVMFIDEAYQLAPRDSNRDSFAKEAIDFLNQFLSEHKDDLACIIAGYEEELEKTIFSMNEGLKRRFPWKFNIDPYTNEELLEIFNRMIEKIGYQVEEDAINATTFATNTEWFKFAGGDIETFITKCKFIHTRNTFGQTPNNIFSKQDIEDALEDHKKHKNTVSNDPPPGIYL